MATDTTLDKFLTYGTNADRIAFVPVPPTNILVEFYETDTGNVYIWYSGTWFQIGGTGSTGSGSTTVTLTNADIKALPTTPFTLVAAPGAGKIIWPSRITLITKNPNVAYTNISPDGWLNAALIEGYSTFIGNDSTIAGFTQLDDLLADTAGQIQSLFWPWSDDAGAFNDWGPTTYTTPTGTPADVNQPLTLSITNAALGNLTGGNAANSLMVISEYKTITLP